MKTVKINHEDYSNVWSFAHAVEVFEDAAILPNREVMAACLRAGGKRARPVEVALLHDGELRSGYRVGGEFGELILIDAADGSFRVFDLGTSDEDSRAEVSGIMAELTASQTC